MNRERKYSWRIQQILVFLGLAMLATLPALAQVPVDEYGNPIAPLVEGATPESFDDEALPVLSAGELEAIVGPVALYPDDLLAIVLPASTYPLQVVQAARFLEQLETNPTLKPDEEWDESVTALLNYPEVVDLMNDDIDWTWRLGEAVVAQQADVIAAIEVFRDKAYAAGNLKSDEYQNVNNEDGVIEIEPVSDDVIYVPYYEPERVVIYQPRPVYHYYPHAYPVYYYPYSYGHSFASDYFWGVTTAFTIGWMTDHLHVYHHSYWGHPYYGRHYQSHYYYRRPSLIHFNNYYVHNSSNHWNYRYRDGDYWRPRRHGGARPGHDTRRVHYYRDRNRDDWRHRGSNRQRNTYANNRSPDGNNGGSWASSRDHNQNRSSNNRRRSHDDQRGDTGNRQARKNDRSNPAERRDRNAAAPTDSNSIRFQPRDDRGRADADKRRTRASQDPNPGSQRRASFAASTSRPSAGSNRPNTSRTAHPRTTQPVTGNRKRNSSSRSSNGSGREHEQRVAMNNPRRQVQTAPPRQTSRPPVQRSQPKAASRSGSATRPSNPEQNSGSRRRSERGSSKSSARGPSSRSEGRSRREH